MHTNEPMNHSQLRRERCDMTNSIIIIYKNETGNVGWAGYLVIVLLFSQINISYDVDLF